MQPHSLLLFVTLVILTVHPGLIELVVGSKCVSNRASNGALHKRGSCFSSKRMKSSDASDVGIAGGNDAHARRVLSRSRSSSKRNTLCDLEHRSYRHASDHYPQNFSPQFLARISPQVKFH
ncbi:hypothetical protein FA10DRAFT_259104 [Acaromyces ingoldii]|uniref:Secreted protein n=1 Tax=Acaromyces ingoldii TaxID=215250 RepID=A0A316YQY1_9BASI|nr:hypothetical protein FA10DRAFT_259104 [Acaromyces ingoldii]PWN91787.1 hypothetical protein FA10DRAFT_259104 [Acaromyces ingoldii]